MLMLGKSPHILGKTIYTYLHQSNASYVPVLCCIHWFDKQTSSHITIMSCSPNIAVKFIISMLPTDISKRVNLCGSVQIHNVHVRPLSMFG